MFSYLHNGTYHTDVSSNYMDDLGLDGEAQQGILAMKEHEKSNETAERKLFKFPNNISTWFFLDISSLTFLDVLVSWRLNLSNSSNI